MSFHQTYRHRPPNIFDSEWEQTALSGDTPFPLDGKPKPSSQPHPSEKIETPPVLNDF